MFRLTERNTMHQLYTEAQAEETLTGREALCEVTAGQQQGIKQFLTF